MRPAVLLSLLLLATASGLPKVAHAGGLAPAGPGLTSLWRAEGDATDAIGGRAGLAVGGVQYGPGMVGQGFVFDGLDSGVFVGDDATLYPAGGSFTVVAWVRTTQATGTGTVAALRECGDSCVLSYADPWVALQVKGGHAAAFLRDGNALGPDDGGVALSGSSIVADGQNHLLAFARDADAQRLALYVDGVREAQVPLGPGSSGSISDEDGLPDPFTIGTDRATGPPAALMNPFSGTIDEVGWWTTPLQAPAMQAIVDAGPGGMTTDDARPISAASAPQSVQQPAITVSYTAHDVGSGAARGLADPAGLAQVRLEVRRLGEVAFLPVGTDTTGAPSGSFAYTAPSSGAYEFRTVATDRAGNVEAVAPAADATTIVALPQDAVATTPAPGPAASRPPAAKRLTIGEIVVGLPGTHACLSRRTFRVHLRAPKGLSIVSATIAVSGRRAIVRRRAAELRAPVDLRNLPAGRFTVRIGVRLTHDHTLSDTRHYRTCAPKQAHENLFRNELVVAGRRSRRRERAIPRPPAF